MLYITPQYKTLVFSYQCMHMLHAQHSSFYIRLFQTLNDGDLYRHWRHNDVTLMCSTWNWRNSSNAFLYKYLDLILKSNLLMLFTFYTYVFIVVLHFIIVDCKWWLFSRIACVNTFFFKFYIYTSQWNLNIILLLSCCFLACQTWMVIGELMK